MMADDERELREQAADDREEDLELDDEQADARGGYLKAVPVPMKKGLTDGKP
jgi:hypothetical protein